MPTRRQFVEMTAAAAGTFALSPRLAAFGVEPGFRGTLCFFSKHLPGMDARRLGRTLKTLGFGGVDLTVRPGGHVDPKRVAQDLRLFADGIRGEGLALPMITTDLTSADDPAAAPTLETAAALKIPFFKPGYYRYAFKDVRQEVASAGAKLRGLAALSAQAGVHLGYHNHAG